jgi:hypothetical protein
MKLTELEPQFMTYETRPYPSVDAGNYLHHVGTLVEAQGVQFLCPVCFVKNSGPIGTHVIEVSFAGRGVQDNQGSHNREGQPSRWNATGTGYSDLTTTPSILIDPALPSCAGWHGYITNGEVA